MGNSVSLNQTPIESAIVNRRYETNESIYIVFYNKNKDSDNIKYKIYTTIQEKLCFSPLLIHSYALKCAPGIKFIIKDVNRVENNYVIDDLNLTIELLDDIMLENVEQYYQWCLFGSMDENNQSHIKVLDCDSASNPFFLDVYDKNAGIIKFKKILCHADKSILFNMPIVNCKNEIEKDTVIKDDILHIVY